MANEYEVQILDKSVPRLRSFKSGETAVHKGALKVEEGLTITGSYGFDSSGNVNGLSVKVGGTEVIDSSRNATFAALNGNVTSTGSTTARNLEDRFADVVNVKDFGAVGDGSTDDSSAIQAAINHAASIINDTTAYGGSGIGIFFPPGNKYRVATKLTVDNVDGVGFYSDPSRGAVILVDSSTLTVFELGDTTVSNTTYGLHFEGLHFQCTSDSTTTVLFDVYRCIDLKARNCTFQGFADTFKCQKIGSSWITECMFVQTGGNRSTNKANSFITLAGDSTGPGGGMHVSDCEFIGVAGSDLLADCFLIKSVDRLYLQNCHFNFYNYALHFAPDGSGNNTSITDVHADNCYFDGGGSPTNSAYLEGTVNSGSLYQDIIFANCLFRGAGAANRLVEINITDGGTFVSGGGRVRNVLFDGCRFRQAAFTALRALGDNNSFVEVYGLGVDNCVFERNNTSGSATTSGIQAEVEAFNVNDSFFDADDNAATRYIQATLSLANSDAPSFVCQNNNLSHGNCTDTPVNYTAIAGGRTQVGGNIHPGEGALERQQYKVSTTDATSTTIFENVIPLNRAGYIRIVAIGSEADASSPEFASYVIEAGFYRGNTGNASFMGSDPTVNKSEQSSGSPSVSLSLATNTLTVQVTGVASTNMDWAASIEIDYSR